MQPGFIDNFWHGLLQQPYHLAIAARQGQGQPVILLHGIGRSGTVWRNLFADLKDHPYQLVSFDLLGFGASPKPERLRYDIDDHTDALIASVLALHLDKPAIIVGHSLGALVAVRLARRRPDLVKHLILYEMPLYEGLPEKRRYTLRLNVYNRFYDWVVKQQPSFDEANKRFVRRVANKVVGAEITNETWPALVKSLQNTIRHQTAADDLKQLIMPAEVIYGNRDMFVIRGKVQTIFGRDATNITTHTISARHLISPKAASFLAGRILAIATKG